MKEDYVILSNIEANVRAIECVEFGLDYVTMKPLIPGAPVSYYLTFKILAPTNFSLQPPPTKKR